MLLRCACVFGPLTPPIGLWGYVLTMQLVGILLLLLVLLLLLLLFDRTGHASS
jgi:hypothetical protein